MHIVVVGLNHRSAPVEIREKLAFSGQKLQKSLTVLKNCDSIGGCILLSTCNRTEVYAVVDSIDLGLNSIYHFLSTSCEIAVEVMQNYLYSYTLYNAVRHLFRVASGLDSMILGETQILGQVRQAYQIACENDATNHILNNLFQQAISVGKKVRTETQIDQNAVSVSYAAVELTKKYFSNLTGKSVLILGAGKMSELTVKYLIANGVSTIFVTNRSYERACTLANILGGKAVKLAELNDYLLTADILISCSSAAHYIMKKEDVEEVLFARTKELLLIDIAVPRDIEPAIGEIPGVILHDIDDLKNVIDNNLEKRKKAALVAADIINMEVNKFFTWLSSLDVIPTVVALKQKAGYIKEQELTRALHRLASLSEKEKNIIAAMANSIVNQLLHDPIINLKKLAEKQTGHLYSEMIQTLFGLSMNNDTNYGDLDYQKADVK